MPAASSSMPSPLSELEAYATPPVPVVVVVRNAAKAKLAGGHQPSSQLVPHVLEYSIVLDLHVVAKPVFVCCAADV